MRHSFWTLMLGGAFTSLTVYGSNQATIQRYLTIEDVKEAKKYINNKEYCQLKIFII